VAAAVDAVPALWSGPRRHPTEAIPPFRPPEGRPPGGRVPGKKPKAAG